jgi:hypothetical protein
MLPVPREAEALEAREVEVPMSPRDGPRDPAAGDRRAVEVAGLDGDHDRVLHEVGLTRGGQDHLEGRGAILAHLERVVEAHAILAELERVAAERAHARSVTSRRAVPNAVRGAVR